MTIVSISINDKLLKEVDSLKYESGFSGRSEVIRASLRNFIAENNERKRLKGQINSVLMATHGRKSEKKISDARHKFGDIVKTHIHNQLSDAKCLEIFVLTGDSKRVKRFFEVINASKGVSCVKLLTP